MIAKTPVIPDDVDVSGLNETGMKILPLWLQGWSHAEIGLELGLKEAYVSNVISSFKKTFKRLRKARAKAKLERAALAHLEHQENLRSGVGSVFGSPPVNWRPNFTLHAGQQEILDAINTNLAGENSSSYFTICAARGFGKTLFAGTLLVEYLQKTPNAKVLWVGPQYSTAMAIVEDFMNGVDDQGNRFVDDVDDHGNKVFEVVSTKSGTVIRWWNGSTVAIRSGDSPESLVSRGYGRIFIDEAAMIDSLVYQQRIIPTARKTGAKVFLISTPAGRNWFYDLYLKGQDTSDTKYLSFRKTYRDNPSYSPLLIDTMKDLPDWVRRQEFEAEFLEDGSGVFAGIDKCISGPEIAFPYADQEWDPEVPNVENRTFIMGLDLARQVDFTVALVLDASTGELVYYRRVNKRPYLEILPELADVCRRFNAMLVYDGTGVGLGLSELIDRLGLSSRAVTFTNTSKQALVNKLAVTIEEGRLQLPNISTIVTELRAFTYRVSKTGKIVYVSGSGIHDDVVMALALANDERTEFQDVHSVNLINAILALNSGHIGTRDFHDFMANDDD